MNTIKNVENNAEQKKAFDATVCFSFFGTWVEAIEEYENASDENSNAYRLFKAIAYYSMYGTEPEFEDMGMNAIWRVISREIDNSVGRRKCRFGKEKVTEKEQIVIDAWTNSPGASVREVAEATGIHRSSVERIRKKYGKQLEELRRNADAGQGGEGNSSDIPDTPDTPDISNIKDCVVDCPCGNSITETRQRDTVEKGYPVKESFDIGGVREAIRDWIGEYSEGEVDDGELPF